MNKPKMKLLITAALITFFTLGCQSTQQINSNSQTYTSGTMMPAEKHYLQAYLSYAVDAQIDNIGSFKDPSDAVIFFNNQAHLNIYRAVNSKYVKPHFGSYELVWYPSVSVDYIGRHDIIEKSYVVKNLIYCLKIEGPNNSAQYLVGISGTDELSPDDWLREDFTVKPLQKWKHGAGNITKGTQDGFNIISTLTSSTTTGERGISLKDYIAKDSRKYNSTVVSVAGHSLGGALTQVYASFLKNTLSAKTTVESWVYAGPSAGDSTFAQGLINDITAENYHAYNNFYDMIPHAWDISALEEICTLYDSFSVCGSPMADNVYLKTIVSYLIDQSKGGELKSPGTPIIFNKDGGTPSKSSTWDCVKLDAAIATLIASSPSIDLHLAEIYEHCDYDNRSSVKSLMVIMTEMGNQHTTVYFDKFIGTPYQRDVNFLNTLNTAVPAANTGVEFVLQASDVLSDFLARVANDTGFECQCN